MESIRCRSCEDPSLTFVFGSNEMSTHGLGAAKHAEAYHGAKWGVGFGPSDYQTVGMVGLKKTPVRSFAIPTKDWTIGKLPLRVIAFYVERFLAYAKHRNDLRFDLTPIGCGLAGYRAEDIAPMFKDAPSNVLMPELFQKVLDLQTKTS